MHKRMWIEELFHDHFGARSTITLGRMERKTLRKTTITLGHNPIVKNKYTYKNPIVDSVPSVEIFANVNEKPSGARPSDAD